MSKTCGNHPDSPAVAECGACAKPVCLMCVEEAPEGTFCSAACVESRRARARAEASAPPVPLGTCANHSDSPAVARCKVCEKGVCVLCIVDAAEGTFCSERCVQVMAEVKGWVEEPSVVLKPDALPPPPARPAKVELPPLPPASPAPAVGRSCASHPGAAAVGDCDRCGKAVCRACRVAFSWGSFCSAACAQASAPAGAGKAADRGRPVALALAAVALLALGVTAVLVTTSSPEGPPVAKSDPDPVLKSEPPKPAPVAKPEPAPTPQPEPVPVPKPEPPKPAPVAKPEPAPTPKPDPVPVPKPEPPKPAPVAKPEPAPTPKPEPVPVPKPEPPKPAPVAKPEPAATPSAPLARHLVKAADPWAEVESGAWYRIRTTDSGKVRYTDVGLRERGPWYAVLVSQVRAEKTEPEQHRWIERVQPKSAGELRLELEGVDLDLDLVSLRGREPEVNWVVRGGRNAGVVVKREGTGPRVRIVKARTETVVVKERAFECLRVDMEEAGTSVRRWHCADVPLAALKSEREGFSEALVDWGTDWLKRPPFPATAEPVAKAEPAAPPVAKPETPKPPAPVVTPDPKPEPAKPEPKPEAPKPPPPVAKPDPKPVPATPPEAPKPPPPAKPEPKPETPKPETPPPAKEDPSERAKKDVAEAAARIREATPRYRDVAAADPLPARAEDLKLLLAQAETAHRLLREARVLYLGAKAASDDPDTLDRRVGQIDSLLASLAKRMALIESALR